MDKVIEVVVEIALGAHTRAELAARTHLRGRNARYYGNAAAWLGLARRIRGGFLPTSEGLRFAAGTPDERTRWIGYKLWNRPVFVDGLVHWTWEEERPDVGLAREWLRAYVDLANTTVDRRAQTAVAWIDWLLDRPVWTDAPAARAG